MPRPIPEGGKRKTFTARLLPETIEYLHSKSPKATRFVEFLVQQAKNRETLLKNQFIQVSNEIEQLHEQSLSDDVVVLIQQKLEQKAELEREIKGFEQYCNKL
jgi:hypothetical protein